MQEQNFNELKEELGHALSDLVPREEAPTVKSKVAAMVDQMNADNRLLCLPEDEYHVLLAYRQWKKSPQAVTGIFHHKPKGWSQDRQEAR